MILFEVSFNTCLRFLGRMVVVNTIFDKRTAAVIVLR